jgi:hypothetical protein
VIRNYQPEEMRMFRKGLVLIALCAGTGTAMAQQTADQGASPTPGPNEAVVYFVRPAKMGFAINFWAFVDQRPIGVTKGNQHVAATVPAGEHIVWSRSGNVSALKMSFEAGQTYYLEQKVKMGGMRARVSLEVLDAEAGRTAVAETKPAPPPDGDAERGEEIAAAEYAEAAANATVPGA